MDGVGCGYTAVRVSGSTTRVQCGAGCVEGGSGDEGHAEQERANEHY